MVRGSEGGVLVKTLRTRGKSQRGTCTQGGLDRAAPEELPDVGVEGEARTPGVPKNGCYSGNLSF